MRELIKDLIPHAPQMGLFVEPNIPPEKLRNALADYARELDESDVLVLYDATLMGSAKDGAVFTSERLIFQNNDLESVHEVGYEDVVNVESRRKLIGGRRVIVTVNRGRATFDLEIDFSGRPDAAQYVLRFLKEAMLRDVSSAKKDTSDFASRQGRDASAVDDEMNRKDPNLRDASAGAGEKTDVDAVRTALEELRARGVLSSEDFRKMLEALRSAR